MEYHVVVIAVEAELEEGAGGGGAFLAEEGDVDGTVGRRQDDAAAGGGLRAVHLAHGRIYRWPAACCTATGVRVDGIKVVDRYHNIIYSW